MKKSIYSTFLLSLFLLAATPRVWGQSLDDIYVCASASVEVANGTGGQVDVLNSAEGTPEFTSESKTSIFYVQAALQVLMEYNSQAVRAYFMAQPDAGYYLKHWYKTETAESFAETNHIDSVMSNRIQLAENAYWAPLEGEGLVFCDNGDYFASEEPHLPCGGVLYTEAQSIGHYQAVFAPIPVNSCTGGQIETVYLSDASKTWNVTFATSHARNIDDFNAPVLTGAVTAGGTFSFGVATFADNVVTVPVTFTRELAGAEGNYTTELTLSSKGGASLTVTIKAMVEEDVPDGVVATIVGGDNYTSFEAALAAVSADATLQLRRDINLTGTQNVTKTFTLDLNGKTLRSSASPILNINGGNLTIVDSKMVGRIERTTAGTAVCVTTGSLTMNRGTIAATAATGVVAVAVNGGIFTLNDGLLQATATTQDAKALYVNGGTVVMKAGELQATAPTEVATLYANGGTTTVENGSITATLNGASDGKAVHVANGATVTIQRAAVLAQATGSYTGNLYAAYVDGTLNMSKKAELKAVSGNNSTANALYVGASSAVVLDGAKLLATKIVEENAVATQEVAEASTLSNLNIQAAFFGVEKDNLANVAANREAYRVAAGVEYNAGYRSFVGASYEKAKDNGVSMFRIGDKAYTSLEDALLYAQNNPGEGMTILQVNDYTLPAGYYTLPANATLLIPYDAEQLAPRYNAVKRVSGDDDDPAPYCTLTLSTGANLDVYGIVEVAGKQRPADAIFPPGAGAYVAGTYGWMKMETGSTMTLEGNSVLYGWGYITGQGEIEARRDAVVREFFQIQDWPGAMNAMNRWLHGVFPLNQYFIQNIEAPTSYHPGSKLYGSFSASGGGITLASDAIQVIGSGRDNAMFLMENDADAENTWVRKWYDVENDLQVYDVNSGAHLGSMVIPLPMLRVICAAYQETLQRIMETTDPVYVDGFDSKLFTLPITSNMKIHLLTGSMDITQATEMLPGSEIEVDKEATVTLNDSLTMEDGTKKEVSLLLYDNKEWGNYARGGRANRIRYTPSRPEDGNRPSPTRDIVNLPDAKLNVHGTFLINGKLYTTASGANIHSNNDDAGTVRLEQAMPVDSLVSFFSKQMIGEVIDTIPCVAAWLKNSDGQSPAYAQTAGTPAGQSFCFIQDRWSALYTYDDSTYVYNNYGEWFIKPGAYVAVATVNTTEEDITNLPGHPTTRPRENADHTYSDANGEGRLFIYMDEQWWEVLLENNLYRGTNGTYYYYDTTEGEEGWKEKKYSVQFVNWDGSPVLDNDSRPIVYDLSYGVMPKFNGTNPKRDENEDYTYTFTGWEPAFVPVTEDAIYTATYEATRRKYTITFLDELGNEIERHFLYRDQMPSCDNPPTKTGYFLTWSPALGAVTGNQTYQATFLPEPPTEFTIIFRNYNGTVLKKEGGSTDAVYTVVKDSHLQGVYDGATPTKPATSEYTYTFTGWSPAITEETLATEDMTFTAQFREVRQSATVIFYQEDGTTQIGEAQTVAYGQMPVIPTYQKAATAQYTYTMGWTPTVTAVSTSGTITYRATVTPVTNRYTVSAQTTGCVVTGVGTYDYNTPVTLSLAAATGYENARWSDGTTEDKTFTVTGDVQFTATATPEESKTLTVGVGTVETLNKETSKASFTLEASAAGAGSLIGADYLRITAGGNVYFRYIFNATARAWYAFSVPFECNATVAANAGGSALQLNVDYDIMQYNGATRAANGKGDGKTTTSWEYIYQKGINTLTPGVLYMIRFKNNQTSLTFTKKASAAINDARPVTLNLYAAGEGTDANWNGIANTTLATAYLAAAGVTEGQVYNADDLRYDAVSLGNGNAEFYVGKPVFIQAAAANTVTMTYVGASLAPQRRAAAATRKQLLTISSGNKTTDRLYVSVDEDAEDTYTIGQDLAKMGVSSKVAQMWVNRYGSRLCVNVTAPENDAAVFPLGIYAPKAGAYTLSAPSRNSEETLYLTLNGEVIANLSEGDYTLDLNKGTTEAYALRLVTRPRGVVTDWDEVVTEQGVQKVIKNGTLYILRDGQAYTVDGQKVDME